MQGFEAQIFGQLNADEYDSLHDPGTTDQAVALISELAGAGPILELAIGTGRVALPLSARGHAVTGIDSSAEMLDKLRQKPGAEKITIHQGDMSETLIEGPFGHVFLIFNTLFNLPSQAAQIACFRNAAASLEPGGTFLIETFVPDLTGFRNGQRVEVKRMDMSSVWLEAVMHDPVAQVFEFQRIRFSGNAAKLVPLVMRYAWPSEIDLMAQLAGLRLIDRWGGWDKSEFNADSGMHISVYQKG